MYIFYAALPPRARAAGQEAIMDILQSMEDADELMVRDGWIHLI